MGPQQPVVVLVGAGVVASDMGGLSGAGESGRLLTEIVTGRMMDVWTLCQKHSDQSDVISFVFALPDANSELMSTLPHRFWLSMKSTGLASRNRVHVFHAFMKKMASINCLAIPICS